MTISQALNIESSEFDNLCTYFTDELKNPDNWTFPVTSMGIDGVEIIDKKYGLWKKTKKNNLGRIEGTNGEQVIALTEDVEKAKIDPRCQPVFIDIDTEDQLTGGHRFETSQKLGIRGWMFVYVRCKDQFTRETFAKALNNVRLNGGPQKQNDSKELEAHIKKWISEGKIKTEQDIENQVELLGNPSLLKNEREKLCRLMVDFVHNKGIKSFRPNRFGKHGKDTWENFKSRSSNDEGVDRDGNPCEVDPYMTNVLDEDNNFNNHFINRSSGTHINTILNPLSKIKYTDDNPWLNLQIAVKIDNCKDSNELDRRRKKFIEEDLYKDLTTTLDDIFEYKVRMGCYGYQHPKCQHSFLAQDHYQEYPEDGQFIPYKGTD